MKWIERLRATLLKEGTEVVATESTNRFLITSYFGRQQHPPLVLHLSEPELRTHLERIGTGAEPVFPYDSVMEAGYKLFLVHLDERIETRKPTETEIRLIGGQLETLSPEMGGS